VPGEMTEEMGRRVRAAVLGATAKAGIGTAIISGLANEYADYFTTPEEFDTQHYEGGATIYGRASSVAIQETLTKLAGALVAGQPAPPAYPFDPTNGMVPNAAAFSRGAASGKVRAQPARAARRLGHPVFGWQGGARGYDRPLDRAFVSVQRLTKRRWRTVDSDLGLNVLWTVDSSGVYTARWEVPLSAPAGKYRFVITASRYGVKSHAFTVRPSRALTALAVPGGIELRYPPAQSHEAVGEPPGDVTADLTNRPSKALSGRATFLVKGKKVTVKARRDGLFKAPAGAELKPGSARDRYGNANGNDLKL
jgi:neutral ceramidase